MTRALALLALIVAALAGSAWLATASINLAHDEWIAAVPAISYRTALALTVALAVRRVVQGVAFAAMKDLIEGDDK